MRNNKVLIRQFLTFGKNLFEQKFVLFLNFTYCIEKMLYNFLLQVYALRVITEAI